jgi:hypothetical protein
MAVLTALWLCQQLFCCFNSFETVSTACWLRQQLGVCIRSLLLCQQLGGYENSLMAAINSFGDKSIIILIVISFLTASPFPFSFLKCIWNVFLQNKHPHNSVKPFWRIIRKNWRKSNRF